ncbi:MAG TPA: ATP-dependent DNA helicase RecG, partial [Clostridia bacterium]|nr:ATP-dependent DNA helicase RecG [Clostridia bacterium]
MPLNQDIKFLKGVGPRRAELFAKCGVSTVGGLLRFYPRVYEDFTSPVPIASAQPGQICCIRATVASPVREARIRKGMTLYKFRAADDTGVCGITYFNNPYIKNSMVEGREYFFYGKIGGTLLRREMTSPEFEPADSGTGLRPVYPLTAGLTVRMVRAAVSQALKLTMENLNDPLPESLRK